MENVEEFKRQFNAMLSKQRKAHGEVEKEGVYDEATVKKSKAELNVLMDIKRLVDKHLK